MGKQYVRVVSCNTTALCRVLHSIDEEVGISKTNVVIARRAADPDESQQRPDRFGGLGTSEHSFPPWS